MLSLGPMEMLVIVVVALVVLGPKRLPDAMRQVGKGVGEVRRWSTQLTTEVHSAFEPGPESMPIAVPTPIDVPVLPAPATPATVHASPAIGAPAPATPATPAESCAP